MNSRRTQVYISSGIPVTLKSWKFVLRNIDKNRSRLTARHWLAGWISAALSSILLKLQHASYQESINLAVPHSPLFILGFWRSGTTFLHELLSCDPSLGFPSTYSCFHPSHFLLSEAWLRKMPLRETKRIMDNMYYSRVSPQEDEFALFALGARSPYWALMMPSLMAHPNELLDISMYSDEELKTWISSFEYFLQLVTVQQQGKTLVLKSPTHGFRLPLLHKLFPNARYVLIDRNPYEIFVSNVKLWSTLVEKHSLEYAVRSQIEEFILASYVLHDKMISKYMCDFGQKFIEFVRYEDLTKDPISELARIYEKLALSDFESVRTHVEQYLEKVKMHVRNRFQMSYAQKARIDKCWGDIVARKKYTWPSDYITLSDSPVVD